MSIQDAIRSLERIRIYPYYEGPFGDSVQYSARESVWDLALMTKVGIPSGPKLEVGAGWGRVVQFLSRSEGEIWALERSKSYVAALNKIANELNGGKELRKVIVVEGDFQTTSLPDKYFSAVYLANLTIDAIETEDCLRATLASFKRIIRADGMVVIFAIKDESGREVLKQYNGQFILVHFADSAGAQRLKICSIRFDPLVNKLAQEYLIPAVEACEQFYAYSSVTERIWISSEVVSHAEQCGFCCHYGPETRLCDGGVLNGVSVQTIICENWKD